MTNELFFYEFSLDSFPPHIYRSFLSEQEQERIEFYVDDRTKRRFIISRGLLRNVLGQRLTIPPKSVTLRTGIYGKPETDGIFFNLSHAEDRMILALSEKGPLGVDIEKIDETAWSHELELLLFSKCEMQRAVKMTLSERIHYFFSVWTMKESHFKKLGVGLPEDPRSFDTETAEHRIWLALPVSKPFIAFLSTSQEVSHVIRCRLRK